MKTDSTFRAPLAALLIICLIFPPIAFAGGKAGKKYFEEGVKHESSEQWDLAAERYALAVGEDPGNAEYRLRLLRAAQMASLMFIARADLLEAKGDFAAAYNAYARAYGYDRTNETARLKMMRMLQQQRAEQGLGKAEPYNPRTGNLVQASNEIRTPPRLSKDDLMQRIEYREGTSLKVVIENLARQIGLNVIFDESFRDGGKDAGRYSLTLNDVTLAKALDMVLLQNKFIFEQPDRRTIVIYADNPQNRLRMEKLLIKTFYLNNADLNETRTIVQANLGSQRQVHISTQIHALDGEQNQTVVGRSVPVRLGSSYLGGIATGTATGTAANGYTVDNIQYRDVGLVIDVTPTITNEGYVQVKMKLESSNVEASAADATLTPSFTKRSLATISRVQDGVTAVVASIKHAISAGSLNLLFRLRGTLDAPADVVIVAIDDESLRRAGQWPWPRSVMADALNKITQGRPRVVGLDIIYAEASDPVEDRRLAEAIARNGRVILLAQLYETLINYAGPAESFRYHSIADLIDGNIPSSAFTNRIVLVGATAQSLGDTRVVPFMHYSAGQRQASLQASLQADAQLLTQALDNLLSNAIKYSPPETGVVIAAELNHASVTISVRDQGFGIPEEARERIFEKFYRLERDTTSNIIGTGLGLPLAKEIVEREGQQHQPAQ